VHNLQLYIKNYIKYIHDFSAGKLNNTRSMQINLKEKNCFKKKKE